MMNYLNSDRIHYRIKSKNTPHEADGMCPVPYIATALCASAVTAGVIAMFALCMEKKEKSCAGKILKMLR